jgi:hypothetical protein
MSWIHKIVGWTSNNGAEVDSDNNLLVNLPKVLARVGFGAASR